MDAILFDMFLELEYGDEDQKLSGAIGDCSTKIAQAASDALSKVSAHFTPDRKEPQITVSQEPIESAGFLIEMTIFYLL
ncbi:MAG: hypothetical protein AAGG81_05665 [Chlamydiota bacterium]